MLSFPDIAILSGIALIVFGPEKLPKVARQVGQLVGVMRSTSNAFVREMERVAEPVPAARPAPVAAAESAPPAESGPLMTHLSASVIPAKPSLEMASTSDRPANVMETAGGSQSSAASNREAAAIAKPSSEFEGRSSDRP